MGRGDELAGPGGLQLWYKPAGRGCANHPRKNPYPGLRWGVPSAGKVVTIICAGGLMTAAILSFLSRNHLVHLLIEPKKRKKRQTQNTSSLPRWEPSQAVN